MSIISSNLHPAGFPFKVIDISIGFPKVGYGFEREMSMISPGDTSSVCNSLWIVFSYIFF